MILDWPKMYKEKLTDAHTALAKIRRGARIFIASACGEPQLLVQTLLDMARMFADVEIIHFLDLGLILRVFFLAGGQIAHHRAQRGADRADERAGPTAPGRRSI